jgi:hypothetical protein
VIYKQAAELGCGAVQVQYGHLAFDEQDWAALLVASGGGAGNVVPSMWKLLPFLSEANWAASCLMLH